MMKINSSFLKIQNESISSMKKGKELNFRNQKSQNQKFY
jgi:hypothetical protein